MSRRLFICCGMPKSGTTFLQRTLNLHPEVSCPSEQDFSFIARGQAKILEAYNSVLQVIDRRTGGQGHPTFGAAVAGEWLASTIEIFARAAAGTKPIYGINDNGMTPRLEYFDDLLDHPKIIVIVRNPVDQALSMWRHNHRLAKEEPERRESHLRVLTNPEGSPSGYAAKLCEYWKNFISGLIGFASERDNVTIVLYERLVFAKKAELGRLFAFLEASISEAVLDQIVAASTKRAMSAASSNPAFFAGDAEGERLTIPGETRRKLLDRCEPTLSDVGYNLPTLMFGH